MLYTGWMSVGDKLRELSNGGPRATEAGNRIRNLFPPTIEVAKGISKLDASLLQRIPDHFASLNDSDEGVPGEADPLVQASYLRLCSLALFIMHRYASPNQLSSGPDGTVLQDSVSDVMGMFSDQVAQGGFEKDAEYIRLINPLTSESRSRSLGARELVAVLDKYASEVNVDEPSLTALVSGLVSAITSKTEWSPLFLFSPEQLAFFTHATQVPTVIEGEAVEIKASEALDTTELSSAVIQLRRIIGTLRQAKQVYESADQAKHESFVNDYNKILAIQEELKRRLKALVAKHYQLVSDIIASGEPVSIAGINVSTSDTTPIATIKDIIDECSKNLFPVSKASVERYYSALINKEISQNNHSLAVLIVGIILADVELET